MQVAARRRRIRILGLAFSGLVAAMAAVVAIVWVNVNLIQRAGTDVAEAQGELAWADAALDAASDQKNALAGILATHDKRYVTPFEQGRQRFDQAMERLTAFALDDTADQRRDMADASRLANSWTLTVAEPQAAAAAAGRVLLPPSGRQLESIDQVERDLDDLRDSESRLAARRQLVLAGAYRVTRIAVLSGSTAALAFVLVILGMAARQLLNDRRRAEEVARDLGEALERVRSAEQTKTRFLANMSHEMRTPLNGVTGMTQALSRTELDPVQRELVDAIRFSSSTLDHLIGDLIAVSRDGVASPLEHEVVAFGLGAAVRAIALPFGVAAQAKGLAFASEIDPAADTLVTGDAESLGELLACLLSNAIKFTDQGKVGVCVRRLGEGTFRVEVSDTGIGFDAAQKARMFETFNQQDDSDTRRFGGAGLGLAVARRLAEELGGVLDARSTPGQGSVFRFDLALTIASDNAESDAAVRPEAGVETDETPWVLIVDDNSTNRKVLELILEQIGVRWISVEDGQQAVEAARVRPFTAILMDIQMPVMDGLTATREIRRIERETGRPAVPVIIVSASCEPEHVRAGRDAGAQRHLGKPVGAQGLIQALNEVLDDTAEAA